MTACWPLQKVRFCAFGPVKQAGLEENRIVEYLFNKNLQHAFHMEVHRDRVNSAVMKKNRNTEDWIKEFIL